MHGLDGWIAGLGGGSVLPGFAAALLLGIRHASDPDHVTARAPPARRRSGQGAGTGPQARRSRAGCAGIGGGRSFNPGGNEMTGSPS